MVPGALALYCRYVFYLTFDPTIEAQHNTVGMEESEAVPVDEQSCALSGNLKRNWWRKTSMLILHRTHSAMLRGSDSCQSNTNAKPDQFRRLPKHFFARSSSIRIRTVGSHSWQ